MLYVKLEQVEANPWQSRQGGNGEPLAELAADIRERRQTLPTTKGLLQLPVGRLVKYDLEARGTPTETSAQNLLDLGRARIQLAFGHRRLAAFRLLAEEDPGYYGSIPVQLEWLTNQEMATAAWAENYDREDLTPAEEARALKGMMESFGWTQEALAKKVGLARSTVANKLRVLTLPEEQLAKVDNGQISERQALALLPAYRIPEAARANLTQYNQQELEKILEHPEEKTSDQIRHEVARITIGATEDLDSPPFPLEWELDAEGVKAKTCTTCALRLRVEDKARCADRECYTVRTRAYIEVHLQEASRALGIDHLLPSKEGSTYEFYTDSGEKQLEIALAKDCGNLRLCWRESWQENRLGPPDWPKLRYVCAAGRGGRCDCKRGEKSQWEIEQEERKKDEAKRKEALKPIKEDAIKVLAAAIDRGELGALRAILGRMSGYGSGRDAAEAVDSRPKACSRIAREIVNERFGWSWGAVDEKSKQVQAWLANLGLVAGESEDPAAKVQRKLQRVLEWVGMLAREQPTAEQVRGNLENLLKLAEEIEEIETVPEALEASLWEIAHAVDTLQGMANLQLEEMSAEDWGEIPWLVDVPAEDTNFKGSLKRASREALQYSLVLVEGREGYKTKEQAIRRRLKALEKVPANV